MVCDFIRSPPNVAGAACPKGALLCDIPNAGAGGGGGGGIDDGAPKVAAGCAPKGPGADAGCPNPDAPKGPGGGGGCGCGAPKAPNGAGCCCCPKAEVPLVAAAPGPKAVAGYRVAT